MNEEDEYIMKSNKDLKNVKFWILNYGNFGFWILVKIRIRFII